MESKWSVCGAYVDYVESMWSLSEVYVECMWNPCGVHVDFIWNVGECKIQLRCMIYVD